MKIEATTKSEHIKLSKRPTDDTSTRDCSSARAQHRPSRKWAELRSTSFRSRYLLSWHEHDTFPTVRARDEGTSLLWWTTWWPSKWENYWSYWAAHNSNLYKTSHKNRKPSLRPDFAKLAGPNNFVDDMRPTSSAMNDVELTQVHTYLGK